MNKKGLLITLIALVVLLAIAGVLYPKLSSGMQTQQLATTPPATTQAPEETGAPTEATGFYRARLGWKRSESFRLHRQTHRAEFLGQLVRPLPDGNAGIQRQI